jgi:hypothetical protein
VTIPYARKPVIAGIYVSEDLNPEAREISPIRKIPWIEHDDRCPQAPGISRSVPLPGSRGGPSGRAWAQLGGCARAVDRARAGEISADLVGR